MMTFSDYAIPSDWPTYLPNKKVAQYFDMYADHFNLKRYIRFGTKVVEVRELHDDMKRWLVRSHPVAAAADNSHQEITEETFDYVMMCSGHHWKPRYPTFQGMDASDPKHFTGEQLHSHFYRQADAYRDKNVLVVGLGNSAVDLAVELSMNQSQVYLSCRRGAWLITAYFFRRASPPSHENLRPVSLPFASHPTVNTLLHERVSTGTVKPTKNVRKLGPGKRVEFEDGTVVNDIDVIFYCTGYHISFPVLDSSILSDARVHETADSNHQVWVWNYMLPPRHPNLAFIGLFQPLGAIMPISEMQARFLVRTLVGKTTSPLPSEEQMDKEIQELKAYIRKRYDDAPRHTIQVDYSSYCDDLANRIGCFPTLSGLVRKFGLIEGFRLKFETVFGPPTPLQYRLIGPHAWEGARDACWGYAGRKDFAGSKYLQDDSLLPTKSRTYHAKEE
ncbi:Cyclopentanone 1,2-monooxygenase (CPMO) [Gryganskiella cystojenkinii]|nr:Cyclopentanone 1,2-monooxygenase (CPMO) [Gryganskiella cystojenkinii]